MARVDREEIARTVLGGRSELFAADFAAHAGSLAEAFSDQTVCVIGAGGSIGRITSEVLLGQRPRRTLLVDWSENNLAEVTRRLRNVLGSNPPDFESWPLDYTGAPFAALLERERPGVILNFAAYKHVRSEKDQLTLAEMIRVNVLGNLKLLNWVREHGARRYFVISTDKAVNPASCMGATKRLMERLIFAAALQGYIPKTIVTTTRFANVLFSDGSLPASFLARLEQRQPLTGPSDIERYFISPLEAGRLCLLAAAHLVSGEILIPRMRPGDLMRFDVIAERLLASRRLKPKHYGSDHERARACLDEDLKAGYWPCLFSPSTTSGEKAYEEFREDGEDDTPGQPYHEIEVIRPAGLPDFPTLSADLERLGRGLGDMAWLLRTSKEALIENLSRLVPSFRHIETGQNLDTKL